MKIYNLVEKELERFRKECNFTEEERECFELKARDKSNQFIALKMNMSLSKVTQLNKRIRQKINKVNC